VTVKEHSLVILPSRVTLQLPCPDLPELVIGVVDAVIVSAAVDGCLRVIWQWGGGCRLQQTGVQWCERGCVD